MDKGSDNRQYSRVRLGTLGPLDSLKDPCSEVTCSYGSTCIQSSDGLSAKCMCPLSCDHVPKVTVCGSDGLDYPSECALNMKACSTNKNIRLQDVGSC
ncbi:agrin isoform X1, partial [Tachysurus ichikawai]